MLKGGVKVAIDEAQRRHLVGLGVLPQKKNEIWWSESDSGGFLTVALAAVPTYFNK